MCHALRWLLILPSVELTLDFGISSSPGAVAAEQQRSRDPHLPSQASLGASNRCVNQQVKRGSPRADNQLLGSFTGSGRILQGARRGVDPG